jgi:hypothetical protein
MNIQKILDSYDYMLQEYGQEDVDEYLLDMSEDLLDLGVVSANLLSISIEEE